jgi:AcrR family transcriptional regulator
MDSPLRRRDIPPLRRAQILAAAAELFSRRGYQGVTVDAIARQAGISKGNLYWHFRSKQEIFELLLEDILQRFDPLLQEIAGSDAPPRDKLRALTRALLETAAANPEAMSLVLQIAAQPELRDMVSAEYVLLMSRYIDTMTQLFADAGEENPRDVAALYALVTDALMGMVVVSPDLYDKERILALLEERFISFGRDKDG